MTRAEKDVLGEVELDDNVYYGVNTIRAKNNFQISGIVEDSDHIRAMTVVKRSAAIANNRLKALSDERKDLIVKASDEIIGGKFHDQFVIDVYQAGAGTSFNMNTNEVIANVALELSGRKKGDYSFIHPNDHVNMSQSTNDAYPTMMRISAAYKGQRYMDELKLLIKSMEKKAEEFKNVKKPGRTHLQDAAPVTLGMEFSAYAYTLKKNLRDFENAMEFILELNIGGTATGTGINTPDGFQKEVVSEIAGFTGFNFRPSENLPGIMEFQSDFARLQAAVTNNALDINKIANDTRLMYSGPGTGIHEIFIPAVQQGSSIMPGKINPSIAEAMNMICHSVVGAQGALNVSVQAGQFELNVMMPNIDYELSRSLQIMTNGMKMFRTLLIDGIGANEEACREHLSKSFGSAALLNPYLGYDTVAKIVREALETHKSIKELVMKTGKLSEEEYVKIMSGGIRKQ
ncbi:MAG: aspartate ammonia-lyase [Candidatus Thermoplasmatota archaeon]|jgi:fumarate hydratase class II/aspartate ammonia-lyase|nr:aspartate ammonia-lyase [Candidatus Thermoplasmatota archaeon]